MRYGWLLFALAIPVAACGGDDGPPIGGDAGGFVDGGADDGGGSDADVGDVDAGPSDDGGPGGTDGGPGDDGGATDGGGTDAGSPDAGRPDAGPPDAGPPDAGPPDAGPPDAGPPDSGIRRCLSNAMCASAAYCAAASCTGPGTCTTRPTGCPRIVRPVCGCDGMTYTNDCLAASAGVRVADPTAGCPVTGGCVSNADCVPTDYCAGTGCGTPGMCATRPTICLAIFDPVCGCDGMTYSNACVAASRGQRVMSRPGCPP